MPCLGELAMSPRYSWTVEDLLELTGGGVMRRIVSAPFSDKVLKQ